MTDEDKKPQDDSNQKRAAFLRAVSIYRADANASRSFIFLLAADFQPALERETETLRIMVRIATVIWGVGSKMEKRILNMTAARKELENPDRHPHVRWRAPRDSDRSDRTTLAEWLQSPQPLSAFSKKTGT